MRAPYCMPDMDIRRFLSEKQDWIRKHHEKILQSWSEAEMSPLTSQELDKLFEEMKKILPEKVSRYAMQMGVSYGRITIRNQKTRWGSCSAKGNLNFNCLLMLAPEKVLDYVVVHELAHRKEMNHSKQFWREVENVIPDYRDRRAWLKEHGNTLMQRMQMLDS